MNFVTWFICISSVDQAARLETNFKLHVDQYGEGEIPVKELVEKLMRDKEKADESELPNICPIEWEFNLSSIFVEVDTPLVIISFNLYTSGALYIWCTRVLLSFIENL